MRHKRNQPSSPARIILVIALLVWGGYMMWIFFSHSSPTANSEKDTETAGVAEIKSPPVTNDGIKRNMEGAGNAENSPTGDTPTQKNIAEQYPQNDDSIVKFVSHKVSFHDVKYIPKDLVSIKSSKTLTIAKSEQMRRDALEALIHMSEAFYEHFQKPLHIVSAYRGYDRQKSIEKNNAQCVADGLCAKAGHSEHQTGLVVDVFEASSEEIFLKKIQNVKYYNWLKDHAHLYGFTQSYRKWIAVDGYHVEPWHWRYVGIELATHLYRNNLTLSEWYQNSF